MSDAIYRVEWRQGNGYRCGCCRRTWEANCEFATRKAAIECIREMRQARDNPTEEQRRNDEDDVDNIKMIVIGEVVTETDLIVNDLL